MGCAASMAVFDNSLSPGSRRFKMQSISMTSKKLLPTMLSREFNPKTSFASAEHCSSDKQFPPNVEIRALLIQETGVFTTAALSGLQT
jgi:hypothetical protein